MNEISQQLELRHSTDESSIWMGRTRTFIITWYLGGHENNIQWSWKRTREWHWKKI